MKEDFRLDPARPAAGAGSKDSERVPVGVVLERRRSIHPWQTYAWRATAVVPRAASIRKPELMREAGGVALFHAATLDIELFPSETEGYRLNLAQNPPVVYVMWRPEAHDPNTVPEPFHLTVCPYEAQDYLDGSDTTVEPVEMPPDIVQWIGSYVLRHHVDEPFIKRKRKRGAAVEPPEDEFG